MKIFQTFFYTSLILLLSACGGGSSSSGGGQTTSAPSVDGTYTGLWTATISVPDFPSIEPETSLIGLTIKITGSEVEVQDGGTFIAQGTLNPANGFDATTGPDFSYRDGTTVCSGAFTFSGAVVNETAEGSSRSLLGCTDLGISFQLLTTGPFTTNKTSNKSRQAKTLKEAISSFKLKTQ